MGISASDFAAQKANDFKRSSFLSISQTGDSRSISNGGQPGGARNVSSDGADVHSDVAVNENKPISGGNILSAQE